MLIKIKSPELNLNSEQNQFNETTPLNGKRSGNLPWKGPFNKFHHKYEFRVTGLSEQSALTLRSQLEWSELATYIGVELALESHGELGKKLGWMLTLKIPGPNSGAVTLARQTLYSMNLGEASMSHIYYGGWIVIRSVWRSKEVPFPWLPQHSGLPQI